MKAKNKSVFPPTALVFGVILGLLLLAFGSAQAQTIYQWNGTPTASSDWGTTANWTGTGQGPTNGTFNARLNVYNAANSPLIYSAAQGTTVYASAGRGLVIGSTISGALTISGGSFSTIGSVSGDIVGNTTPNVGTLVIAGGTFTSTTAGFTMGQAGGGYGNFIISNGTATVSVLGLSATTGTISLDGGTLSMNNLSLFESAAFTNVYKFNGGTLKARINTTSFMPVATTSKAQSHVRNGGAIIDDSGFAITMAQGLWHSSIGGDAAIDGGLTKLGAGTLTLNGTNTYTGPTVVKAGTLKMRLPSSSGSLTLPTSTTNTITVNHTNWAMASAALTNSTLALDYGVFDGITNGAMNVTNLSISGTVKINIIGSGFPVTNITLLTYGSKTGGGSFALGTFNGGAATLVDNGSSVVLQITSLIPLLTWTGATDNNWQTNGTADWAGSSTIYADGNAVVFDDTSVGGTVNIPGKVAPFSTTVNITANTFTFSGAGSIGGSNGIAMTGTSTLTVGTSNTFTGAVTVSGGSGSSGGTLYVNHPNALGATNGGTTISGPANTLELGTLGGTGVTVTGETVTISGTGVGGARGALRGGATASGSNVWAGPVVIGSDITRIGTEDSGNLMITGPITDNGANYVVLFRPGANGVVTVASSGSAYGPTRTFGNGDGSGSVVLGANNALSTNQLQLGLGNVDLHGFNQTVGGVTDSSGPGNLINNGSGPSILTINTGVANSSSAASIVDGASTMGIVKLGTGQQTLSSATLSYTGDTTISQGTLNLTTVSPMASSITVQASGTLSGPVTTTGSLTLNANSTLNINPAAATLTANTVDATASPINIRFVGSLATNGATLVLAATTAITGSAANFQVVGSRTGTFYLTNSDTQLMYVPPTTGATLTWTGTNTLNPSFWDVGTTINWKNGGTADKYFNGDSVVFNDTAGSFTANIQPSSITPGNVTFSNSANNYLVIGGAIGGSASLVKDGSGQLLLANANTYTGNTTINAGTVRILNDNLALGAASGAVIITNGGTLDLVGALFAGNLNLGTKSLQISGAGVGGNGAIVDNGGFDQQFTVLQVVLTGNASIGGSRRWDIYSGSSTLDMGGFTLTKTGTNRISMTGTTVSNPGNIFVAQGTFGIDGATSIGGDATHTLTVAGGAQLISSASTVAQPWSLVLNSNATYAAQSGTVGQNIWSGPVTLNGAVTLQADGAMNIAGDISGTGSIVKTGANILALSGTNTYAGNTTVNGGTLEIVQGSFATNSTITVTNGAVLQLDFADTNTVALLVLGGVTQSAGVHNNTTDPTYLTGTGSLLVTSGGVATNPTNIVFNLTGSTLNLSWPEDHRGWTLQTNSVGLDNTSAWFPYPGSAALTNVAIPVDPAKANVFYRLVYP